MISTGSGVYFVQNKKTGMVYIGQTNNFKRRWRDHRCQLRHNRHDNPKLQQAWNEDGQECFQFIQLEHCGLDQLNEREQHYLDIYMTKGMCYNIAIDVSKPGLGKIHTEETKHKMSVASIGRPKSEEARQKMSKAQKNRTPEHKRKLAESAHNISDETRKKMSESAKNRPSISDETHSKMSEAQKKRPPISEDTRRKMSEARTRWYQRKEEALLFELPLAA